MAAKLTSFKLGLFTLLTMAAVAVSGVVLGVRGIRDVSVVHHTYFDESVVGLDIGAPVKLRGINIGTVRSVSFAEGGGLVDVALAIDPVAARRIAWDRAHDSGLRAQLTSQGITGVKLVDIDMVDVATHPPPALPFEPDARYVPSTRSLLTRLADGAEKAADRLPVMVDSAIAALARLESIFRHLDDRGVADRLGSTLDNVNLAVGDLRGVMRRIDRGGGAGGKGAATLDRLDAAIDSFGSVMGRIDGDAGLVASTQRATEAVDQLGRNAAGATDGLDRTLRDVGDAARAIRDVADALERDPDMLVKGRRKAKVR